MPRLLSSQPFAAGVVKPPLSPLRFGFSRPVQIERDDEPQREPKDDEGEGHVEFRSHMPRGRPDTMPRTTSPLMIMVCLHSTIGRGERIVGTVGNWML